MKKGSILSSVVLMALAIYGMIEASSMERTMPMGIGVDFLPFWISAVIGLLAVLLLIQTLRGKSEDGSRPLFPRQSTLRVLFVLVILLLYISLMEIVGFLVSTLLFFLATLGFLQRSRALNLALFSVFSTLLLYALFKVLLKSPLPPGFLNL
ncbi:MAG: tripartite tricarboxylate transporter TctB family protein [Syntrophaceae bacterium]|nr:tripartite tricarboxylate transporter TctB family protein [Syntrophaceae bacterium]